MQPIRRLRNRGLALMLGLVLLAALSQGVRSETQEVTLPDGRFYRIDLPEVPDGAPLILALHGGGGGPAQFAGSSGLGEAAVRAGFAVAFPAGTGRRTTTRLLTWNGGYCCGHAARTGVDDEAFLKAVIQDAGERFGLDVGRVYMTGMSNGAIMAETFAARNPDLVSAVAGVAGTMDTGRETVRGRVPLLVIHGTADQNVPYTGGRGDLTAARNSFASVPSVVAAFLAPWGQGVVTTARKIDDHDDGTSVTVTDHVLGGRVILRLMTVEGGAHHWPGGRKARLAEGKTAEIDANTEVLRFFALHP